ncbi:MAG: hypothetical protein Q7S40_27160 [Opitutaceae bacterium]|nr:hypothetical protein [Opitutaceae bacterium]
MFARSRIIALTAAAASVGLALAAESTPPLTIDTPMAPPAWARLERELLAAQAPACREFFQKYFDARGYLQCFIRWGANDGPDDAFENFNGWPELHALGGNDAIREMFVRGHEGLLRQYTEARTADVPAGREGMYYLEFSAQSDWMHHGEGLQLFNRMGLSIPGDPAFLNRARRFAGFYMAEDPAITNYDPRHKLIRSMINGSRGPLLRPATALDWVGDPFDVGGFVALHGETTFAQFLAHYAEYTDVVGDHFLNLVATTLPTTAYLATGDVKYWQWVVGYMDAWLDRMRANRGIIPSFVDLDEKIGGPENKWWGNAYGWGFSPMNPVHGRRENRNRIPRAMVGFNNALLVSGDRKYHDAWRTMMDAVNSHGRESAAGREYPSMCGPDGWYGWQRQRWNVGALDLWYATMRDDDRARVGNDAWISFLEGRDGNFPETALRRDLATVARRIDAMRRDDTPPEKRLADNMMGYNPATISALTQLMLGGLVPGRDGGLLFSRLRYFDPVRRRAGLPEDVGALVSKLDDRSTTVTLVNLNATESRTVMVQAGAYGEHRFESVAWNGHTERVAGRAFSVRLAPGAGATLTLAMKRFAAAPTLSFPWDGR